MLFKRQQVLLALVDALDSSVGHTAFQKLLFGLEQESGSEPAKPTTVSRARSQKMS
jgi:hypothetical protein